MGGGGKEEDAFHKLDDYKAKLRGVFKSNWSLFIVQVSDAATHGSQEFLSWVNGVIVNTSLQNDLSPVKSP